MSNMTQMATAIQSEIDRAKEAGAEIDINFAGDSGGAIVIYWENLRTDCYPNELQKAINAIITLAKIGTRFSV